MTRGVQINIEDGGRFERLTVVTSFGAKALVLCDCGAALTATKSNLVIGNTRSCGCLKSDLASERAKRNGAEQTKRGWVEGWWDREQARQQAIENAKAQRGTEAQGLAAKGPENIHAKWYSVKSANGLVLEGRNLSHLIRENSHLFSADDAKWRTNKWGSATDCKAMIGLRSLFRTGPRTPKSWKGWVKN